MSWWAVGITAALGVKKGMDNEARMDKNDKFRKAAITYSPWTGMGDPGSQQLPGALESGVQGGLTGAMLGNAMGNGAGGSTNAVSSGSPSGATLGGAEQSAAIGKMQYTPEQMQPLNFSQGAAGTGGSAGALGANPQNPNDPYKLKYSLITQP